MKAEFLKHASARFGILKRDFGIFRILKRDFRILKILRRDFMILRRDFRILTRDFRILRGDFRILEKSAHLEPDSRRRRRHKTDYKLCKRSRQKRIKLRES